MINKNAIQNMHNQSDLPDVKVVFVISSSLGIGQAANRAACLATGLAAHVPNMIGPDVNTKDGKKILGFTHSQYQFWWQDLKCHW